MWRLAYPFSWLLVTLIVAFANLFISGCNPGKTETWTQVNHANDLNIEVTPQTPEPPPLLNREPWVRT